MKKQKKDVAMAAAHDDTVETPAPVGDTVEKVMGKIKEKAKRRPNVVDTGEVRTVQVRYKFTPVEKATISQNLAQRQIEITELEDEKKSVVASFTERMKSKKCDIAKMSRQVRDGWENRDHECTLILDFKKKERRYRDNGTKKVVLTEAFAPADTQRRFA
jgi:hypothetical protein